MRTKVLTLAFGIASLILALSPGARADTFDYHFTIPATDLFSGVDLEFTITAANLPPSGAVFSCGSTIFIPCFTDKINPLVTGFAWNSAASGSCFGLSFTGEACAAYSDGLSAGAFDFPAGSFLSPGTFTSFNSTLVITDLSTVPAVPEPSSLVLLGSGVLGLLAMASLSIRGRREDRRLLT